MTENSVEEGERWHLLKSADCLGHQPADDDICPGSHQPIVSRRVCSRTKQFVIVTSSTLAAFLDVDPFFNLAPKSFFFFLFFVYLLGNFCSFSVNFSKVGASIEKLKFMTISKLCSFYSCGCQLPRLQLLTVVEDAILQFLPPAPFLKLQINAAENDSCAENVYFQSCFSGQHHEIITISCTGAFDENFGYNFNPWK